MRPRYYVRTVRPHVWAVMRRDDANLDDAVRPESALDTVWQWYGAREYRGDAPAREAARAEAVRMNGDAS